ncbi:MAG: hypothetical protein VB060_00755 [Oscillibacter sp.]|nr:hypothetical protein [Oscillibacter sp.]MEA4992349.1 hypothetical protein [Oscillibacter sp.]
MNAGSITISTELDNKELETQYAATIKKIRSLTDKINTAQAKRSPAADQSAAIAAELDAAKAQLDYMKSGQEFFTAGAIQQQESSVKSIQKDWNKAQESVEKYDAQILAANAELSTSEKKASAIASEMVAAGKSTSLMGDGLVAVGLRLDKVLMRIKKLATRVLFFSVITAGLRSVREWLGKVIETNDEAAAAFARLKGALLVLAQPLTDAIVPALTAIFDGLTKIVVVLAQIASLIFGTTFEKSEENAEALNDETAALDDTGKAAKKAAKSLAAFDEINQLSGSSKDNEKEKAAPSFDFQAGTSENGLKNILGLLETVGALLLGLKISDTFLGGIRTAVGLMIALQGAILLVKSITDAWQNGVDWDNFLGMLAGAAAFAAGLALAFGKVGAAIGLIVSGIAMFATGIHDALASGWTLQNLLTTITGMIMTGLGISILVGSWIPLVIAGIASILLALSVATGHGEELIGGIKDVIAGVKDFILGIISGDIPRAIAGLGKTFDGIREIVTALISGLRDTILSFLSWVDEKTGYQFSDLIGFIKSIISSAFGWIIDFAGSIVTAFEDVFIGITEFLSGVFTNDWDEAWKGLKDIVKGFVQGVVDVFVGFVNLIIKGINVLIDAINSIKVNVPEWVPGIGGKKWDGFQIPRLQEEQIPRLAKGAVIPPNREFMAVLGDQKSGNNYEVPDAKLRQLIREETAGISAPHSGGDIVLQIDGKTFARITNPYYAGERQRVGIKLVGGTT